MGKHILLNYLKQGDILKMIQKGKQMEHLKKKSKMI
ncbi:hypothetical protein EDD68_10277 [Melghiribacillus thermohalophilus]|uniref:Uncharacterized protein n=1 Tax=Melghiribacillus thermohalophilus TaxID=1324956 RepID=A0A4V2V2T8_9BACI|nr:hypothetical protein EDD68_10277 [Melghiribacillus thermohalophilus]